MLTTLSSFFSLPPKPKAWREKDKVLGLKTVTESLSDWVNIDFHLHDIRKKAE